MMFQPDKSDLIPATIKEVEAHEAISHWKRMKKVQVKISTKKRWEDHDYFINLIFQAQEITIWIINKTQIQTLCKCRYYRMGS